MFTTTREAGMLLRALREDAELSQVELARRANVSRRWLVDVENRQTPPSTCRKCSTASLS